MLSLLIFLLAQPAPAATLYERLRCPYLFEELVPQFDVTNFIVPASVPHDKLVTTPVWHRRSTFERAFVMTTEISAISALTDVPPEDLIELERAYRRGDVAPRLRREMAGFAAWSRALPLDRTIDAAIAPTAVWDELTKHLPNSVRHLNRLSVYFFSAKGAPPTLEMVAEARGALQMARFELGQIPADVRLEVHTVGPLPDRPGMYVDFGIDVRGTPRR